MAEEVTQYREINGKHIVSAQWKEIIISTGTSPTIQKDVKFPDLGGGYAYKDSNQLSSCTRNRFIYWRSSENVIELSEVSLDLNLRGQNLRISFTDASVVGEINFFETSTNVVILVCTTTSTHRLVFPHPKTLLSHDVFELGPETVIPSIFADVSSHSVQSVGNVHNVNIVGGHTSYQVHTGAGILTKEGETLFALGVQNGGILVVRMPPSVSRGAAEQHEIKQSGRVSRLFGGLVPSIMRGQDTNDFVTSLAMYQDGSNIVIFAVYKDSKLRFWSALSYEFLGAVDLLEHVPDMVEQSSKNTGGRGHVIKTFPRHYDQSVFIAVFLSFANKCQFVVYHLTPTNGKYQPIHVTTLFGLEGNLVDFYITPTRVWTLWTLRSGEPAVRYVNIDGLGRKEWTEVHLCNPEKLELDMNQLFDPREVYMNYIFHPGRFSTAVILKALKIFRHSTEGSHLGEASSIPLSVLKSEVCQAVEAELRQSIGDEEMEAEEFVQLQLQQWSRFYSCCVQYHERGMKLLGFFSDELTGVVGIVKKSAVGLLYPCPALEQVYLGGVNNPCEIEFLRDHPRLMSENWNSGDLAVVGRCLKLIRDSVEEDAALDFENGILSGRSPVDLVDTIVKSLQDVEMQEVVRDLEMELSRVHNVFQSIEVFVGLLDIGATSFSDESDVMMTDETNPGLGHVFASLSGVTALAEIFRQTFATRLEISRDLLVLVKLLPNFINGRHNADFGVKLQEAVFQLGFLARSFHLLKWCSETMAVQEATSSVESSRKQLEMLNLFQPTSIAVSKRLGDQHLTLLEAFLHGDGGSKIRQQLSVIVQSDQEDCSFWKQILLPMVTMAAQLIWPSIPGFSFPQSLVALGQHLAVQSYVRLLQGWCDFDSSSRQFILGQSYLSCNEPYKAFDCFLAAAHDVLAEEFLISFMSQVSADPKYIEVLYYLQVINLFEQFDFPHLVVELAEIAISMSELEDPNLPTLWSKVFKNELEMGHSLEAYKAMMGNPDSARRKDCLRQFLVVLCERNELSTLIDLPYRDAENNLEQEVLSILESRAVSADLAKQNYYDLLYAFHIRRSNYRKAGTVMYEYGDRMRREIPSLKGLQRQAKCYLACMNALKLGDPKFWWIMRPVVASGNGKGAPENDDTGSPPKRARKENELEELLKLKSRRFDVLSLTDIQKEYALVHAHLMLLQKAPQTSLLARLSLRPDETVGLLANAGMFDLAIELCQIFQLPMNPIFEGLALRCIWLSRGQMPPTSVTDNQYTTDAWVWLQYNEQFSGTVAKDAGRVADCAWRLLQLYLEKYEENSARYYRCVAVKALQQGFDLPSWFLASYKKRDPAELLRLFLTHGFLEDAAELALEYIQATLGKGKDYFGLDDYLHAGSPPVWLPYSSIDHLLRALDDAKLKNKNCALLLHQLSSTLEDYFQVVEKATGATLAMLRQH